MLLDHIKRNAIITLWQTRDGFNALSLTVFEIWSKNDIGTSANAPKYQKFYFSPILTIFVTKSMFFDARNRLQTSIILLDHSKHDYSLMSITGAHQTSPAQPSNICSN